MRLKSSILIERPPQQVWDFLGNPANVAKWDRGVASVEETSPLPPGVGFEFDTIAPANRNLPDQGRMSYRVQEVDPVAGRCVVALTSNTGNARFFKSAAWQFDTKPAAVGTLLTCTAVFELRFLYLFLGPLLHWKKDAILMDLKLLKQAIETQQA